MKNIIQSLLQCGAFLLAPGITFALGLWLVKRFVGYEGRSALLFVALVVSASFFSLSFVGLVMDPKFDISKIGFVIKTSGLVSLIVFAFILLFTPVARTIYKILK